MTAQTHTDFRRLIEQDLLRGLDRARRERLHDHLRGCEPCRAHHDRIHEGFRVLEGEPDVSRHELAQLERWVLQDLPVAPPSRLRLFAWLTPALLAAVVGVVMLRPAPPGEAPIGPGGDPLPANVLGLVAKGGEGPAVLAVDVLCGARPDALHAAAPGGCRLDETLAFAYRAAAQGLTGQLTLFGVDAQGRARYYAPTPVAPEALPVDPGAWQAAPLSVRLQVNHTAGPLRVFALLSPRAPGVEAIDAWAAALARSPTGEMDASDTPWHRHLGEDPTRAETLRALCGADLEDCRSARLDLTLSVMPNEETP